MSILTNQDKERYNRQIILPGVGEEGQQKIQNTRVLVIGAGGLGCPVLQYLTGAGFRHICVVDADKVSLSNLQRQILYTEDEVGQYKAKLAAEKLGKLNSNVTFNVITEFLTRDNIEDVIVNYDIIVGATDNFESRYLIDEFSKKYNKPFVHGSVADFEGQYSVFNYKESKSYSDIFPQAPVDNGKILGVIGAVPGIIGSYMAFEVIKIATEVGGVASDGLYIYRGLNNNVIKLAY
jgi:adenylyltransferase/sulfurtransferase